MRLLSLQLENFKNYRQLEISFPDDRVVILVGKNGQGKTNFLESIVLLALSKGYYSNSKADLVHWNAREEESGLPEYFRLLGSYRTVDGATSTLEVGSGRGTRWGRVLKIDEVKVRPSEYIGHLKVVIFTPQDLNMVFLSPQLRRRYVNVFLSQVDPVYLQHLSQYQVLLRHRNKLLGMLRDQPARVPELDYWDRQLVVHGAYLLWQRRQLFSVFNHRLADQYRRISSEAVDLTLEWKKVWPDDSRESLQQAFAEYITERRQRDIDAGMTCGGPHREDFFFRMKGMNLAQFGSRGECRSVILALKLTEAAYLQERTGDSPLVLFDDVFSELDPERQKNLLDLFAVDQVFITTTHVDFPTDGYTIWTVDQGRILT